MSNPYETCLVEGYAEDAKALATCLAEQTRIPRQLQTIALDKSFIIVPFYIFCASLVFFMQAGFAMVCAGAVRKKNVQNTVLKNLLDLCGAAVSFYSLGFAFAYGDGSQTGVTFIGSGNYFLLGMTDDETGIEYSNFFFQFAFAATSGKISDLWFVNIAMIHK